MKKSILSLLLLSAFSTAFAQVNPRPYQPIPRPEPIPAPIPRPEPIPEPRRSPVIGELVTISGQGEIFGWGCNISSRAPLEVNVYLNGRREYSISAVADQNIRNERRMGLPDRMCGEYSGFQLRIPTEYLDGRYLKIELTGEDISTGQEILLLGATSIRTPVATLKYRTLFEVNSRVYYSSGVNTFCYVTDTDQLSLFNKDGVRITERLNEIPFGMRDEGNCALRLVPKSLFKTQSTGDTVYFSNGENAYCALAFPGLLNHLADAVNLDVHKVDMYKKLPQQSVQANHGPCKVEGVFQVGGDVFYSNGKDAFCHITDPAQIGNRAVYQYEGLPPGLRNDGNCPR